VMVMVGSSPTLTVMVRSLALACRTVLLMPESPRHVRRLHSLGRMESCREIQRSGTRRS
jgi:hypothetical protein